MTPSQYIEKFCRVKDRRKIFYKKVFDRNKIKPENMNGDEYLDLEVI